MDLEEIGVKVGNWVDSAQDRNYWIALLYAALNLWDSLAMDPLVNVCIYVCIMYSMLHHFHQPPIQSIKSNKLK